MLSIPQPFGGLTMPRIRRSAFEGGNQSRGSVLEFARYMGAKTGDGTPTAGGTLTINSQSLGSYDYVIKDGDQTISSFVNSQWFTTTQDSRSAWVVVRGNLTINSGQVLRPANRKLFTVVYVAGDLTVNGEISMSLRGANHGVAVNGGSNITAQAIRIATGTYSGVANPQVPASGGTGGAGIAPGANGEWPGNSGQSRTDGGTGGGGSGGVYRSGGSPQSGDGAVGTSFSGGSGSGGVQAHSSTQIGEPAYPNGGPGGAAVGQTNSNRALGGGGGNPAGASDVAGSGQIVQAADNGTGGVLIIIVEGGFVGTGAVTADGGRGTSVRDNSSGNNRNAGGGGSGGGSVTVMVGGTDTGPSPTALGGAGGTAQRGAISQNSVGGNGGDGTARKLSLAA